MLKHQYKKQSIILNELLLVNIQTNNALNVII